MSIGLLLIPYIWSIPQFLRLGAFFSLNMQAWMFTFCDFGKYSY